MKIPLERNIFIPYTHTHLISILALVAAWRTGRDRIGRSLRLVVGRSNKQGDLQRGLALAAGKPVDLCLPTRILKV